MSNRIKKLARAAGGLLLAYLLVFSPSVWAGQDREAKVNPKLQQSGAPQQGEKPPSAGAAAKAQTQEIQGDERETAAVEEKTAGDGKHEGIKVHGHWTVEVRNPDGGLVTHREFENALAPTTLLNFFLVRRYPVGYWAVVLFGNVCQNGGCQINEAELGYPTNATSFNSLSATVPGTGSGFILDGLATASSSGTITAVRTQNIFCTSPGSPCPVEVQAFTQTTLSTPIQVSAGQTIAVTVNISFS
jgi:hypothetical protein